MNPMPPSGRLVRVLAVRRLAERPLRSVLTASGVAVGVAFMFSVTLLNTQLAATVRQSGAVLSGPRLLQVSTASPGGLPDALVDRITKDPGVATAAPLVVSRSTVSHRSRSGGVFVLGVTPAIAAVAPHRNIMVI